MYIVEKQATFLHGVFWIGDDLELAKCRADDLAAHDNDDYHEWRVREFKEVALPDAIRDAEHNTVYTTTKTKSA